VATDYPGGLDSFSVPTLPEDTPLSQAGAGNTRNLTESVRDQGDAIEAVEATAAQKTHDHSGDAGDTTKGAKLLATNTHENPDTDGATVSIHHTLGTGANQAAAGTHHHDYNGGTIDNTPWRLCTSGTRPGSPYPGLMIYETDTDVVRAWGSFAQNAITTGLNALDDFTRTSSTDLGPTLWQQVYGTADLTHGKMATPNGTAASWIDNSNFTNYCVARRINADDAVTQGDDQIINWRTGGTVIEDTYDIPFIEEASNSFYFRMSSDNLSYVRVRLTNGYIEALGSKTGRSGEFKIGRAEAKTSYANMAWSAQFSDRTILVYRNGVLVATFLDVDAKSAKGAAYRGWGIGMTAGQRGLGQTTPSSIDSIRISDLALYSSVNRWTVMPIANIPIVRLRQATNQSVRSSGSFIEWTGDELEDSFNYFDKNVNLTDIAIGEPGLYQIDAAFQWNPSVAPDTVTVVMCINGVETTVRKQVYMRGGGFSPGFSQTVDLSGKLRFKAGDVVSMKAKYTGPGGLEGFIFSFFDSASKINSRLDMMYLAP
jgi:hypothetical protein